MQELSKVLALLGLNKSQIETYLFIMRNREATLSNIAQNVQMTPTGATKMIT